jgi:hypothetical protein
MIQEIHTALNTATAAVIGLPAIFHENKISKPVAGTPFTRTTLLPARPNQITMGTTGRDELQGLYQIDFYYPVGSGAHAASAAAGLVVAAFPRTWNTTVSGDVLRVRQSWIEAGREVNGWYAMSVVLAWSCVR